MISMPSYSKNDVILIRYPFSDLSGAKVRPAVVVGSPHVSQDLFIVALTSQLTALLPMEFVLQDWKAAGLNVPTAVKRAIQTIHQRLVTRKIGELSDRDGAILESSLRQWLDLH